MYGHINSFTFYPAITIPASEIKTVMADAGFRITDREDDGGSIAPDFWIIDDAEFFLGHGDNYVHARVNDAGNICVFQRPSFDSALSIRSMLENNLDILLLEGLS